MSDESNPSGVRGFFKRLRAKLNPADSWLSYDLANLVPGRKIDAEILDELETQLIAADVGIDATSRILEDLRKRVARKELSAYFSSPAAFIFIGVFLSALLFIFFWVDRFFARNIADVRPLFEWMPILLIFLVSAMTMRMWSEERRAGTLEFLLTAPVHTLDLVIGKFLACLGLVGITLALTLPLPITVSLLGPLDWGPVAGGYIATLALASAYISIGLFVSSRTDNQIVSLIVTTLICGAFYVAGSDALTSLSGNSGSEILRLLGSGSRFDSIARGVIDLRDLIFFFSLIALFLTANVVIVDLKKSG